MGLINTIKNIVLYINGMSSPLVRDFTKDAEEKMIEISQRMNKYENAGDVYVSDKLGRWLDQKGYLQLLSRVNQYQNRVIDYYNYGKSEIQKICTQARDCDSEYGKKISLCAEQARRVSKLLDELAECLDTESDSYDSKQSVYDRLFWFNNHYIKDTDGKQKRVGDISDEMSKMYNRMLPDRIEKEDYIDFCNSEESMKIFEEYTDYVYEEIDKKGALDIVWTAAGTVYYKGVEMTIEEFIGLITNKGYMDNLVYDNLKEIISSMIDRTSVCENFVKDHSVAKESLEKLLEKYLKDIENNKGVNESDKVTQRFGMFINYLGGIAVVKELMETCPQLLDYLFTDYSEGLELIEQVERSCEQSGSKEMRSAVKRLHDEYENKWMGILNSGLDFSEKMLYKLTDQGVKEWVKDNIGDYSVLGTLLDATEMKNDIDAEHKMVALRKVYSDLQEAYEEAVENIRLGKCGEEDFKYLDNMFEAMKKIEITIYETYRDMCIGDPQKQIYLNEQIVKLDKMTIKNY